MGTIRVGPLAATVCAGAFGGIVFGYDIGAVAAATHGLSAHFALLPAGLGVAVAASLIGTIAGSMCAGVIADWMDRRRALLISGSSYAACALGSALALNFAAFLCFRAACGVAIGIISVVSPLYLAEIAPPRLRGRIVGSFQLSLGVAVVIAWSWNYLLSLHLSPDVAWRWSFAGGLIPAALLLGSLLQAVPSPRGLILKRQFDEARIALAKLAPAEADSEYLTLVQRAKEHGRPPEPLFSRRHTRPILLAVGIALFNQLTGVNVLLYYMLDILNKLGSGQLNERKTAILISASGLILTTFAVAVVDKLGRKPLLLIGAAGIGVCLFLLSLFPHLHWPPVAAVAVLVCYNAFFAFSQGTVVWVYLSELFPLPVRARGQSLGSTANWIANAVIIATFPMLASRFSMVIFAIFALLMGMQFLVVLFIYPETKNRNLEALASDISA
jgi:sugar porter (SP) family MFS transporter